MADPLISIVPLQDTAEFRAQAKAAATFVALATVARIAPGTFGPIARYGLGVEVAGVAGLGQLTPLGVTNFLPQPFGFVPAPTYGLKPNFYLPDNVGAGGPPEIPGAAEQTAQRDAQQRFAAEQRARQELQAFAQVQQQRGTEKLQELLAALRAGQGTLSYTDPSAIIGFLERELAQRAAQSAAAEAARVARLSGQSGGGATVPLDPNFILPGKAPLPQNPPGQFTPDRQQPVAPGQGGSGGGVPSSGQAPNGFVVIDGNLQSVAGQQGEAQLQKQSAIAQNNQGNFLDRFNALTMGDP